MSSSTLRFHPSRFSTDYEYHDRYRVIPICNRKESHILGASLHLFERLRLAVGSMTQIRVFLCSFS